jgi:predicted patatin/cPLA2 family phospholipase
VADISLGLNPKPIIETETENYIKAKELSKGFQVLFQQMQDLQNKLRYTYPSYGFGTFKKPSTDNREAIIIQMSSVTKQMSEKNAQAIALGYKILPLGEIEKL